MLEVFANMLKRKASDTGVKKNGKLLFEVDVFGMLVPHQLQLFHKGMKYMLVNP